MSGELFLALDQGTHASRAVVFDSRGERKAQASRSVKLTRSGNCVEQDPRELVESLREVAAEAAREVDPQRIGAAGLATQRSTIVCWSRGDGRALSPALSWQDTRAGPILAARIDTECAGRVRAITGLRVSPHYGASKLRWCLERLAPVREAERSGDLCCGPLSSFLSTALTGIAPCVDPSNAARTLLYDLGAGDWSEEMLAVFGLRRRVLPRCVASRENFGELELGNARVPLVVCAGDQAMVPYAEGEARPGRVYVNVGSGAFLQRVVDDPGDVPGELLASIIWRDEAGSRFTAEGTVNGAGAALDAVERPTGTGESVADFLERCWKEVGVPPLFLNGVGGLGSPWWRPDFASGYLGDATAPGARLVAVAESIAFLLRVNLEYFRDVEELVLGGGVSRSDGFCRRLAGLLGRPVIRLREPELTARGLANRVAGNPPGWRPSPRDRFEPTAQPGLERRFRRWRATMIESLDAERLD